MDGDGPIGLKMTFRLELHRNGAMHDAAWEIVKNFIPSKPATIAVIVSDVAIIVDSWASGSRVIADLREGQVVAIDTKQRCYTKLPIHSVEARGRYDPAEQAGWDLQTPETGCCETLGGRNFFVRRYRLPLTPLGHFVDALVTRDLGFSYRINRIIHWLLGVANLPDSTTLVNLRLGEAHDGSSLARLELAGTEEIEWNDKWLRIPPTYRQGDCLQELIGTLSRFGQDTVRKREVRNSDHRHAMSGSRQIAAEQKLRLGGHKLAWVVRQEYLDQIKVFVNHLTRGVRRFHGDGEGGREPAHLVIDWFQQLEEGGHLNRDMTRERLALLALLAKIAAGEPLIDSNAHPDGLDAAERAQWDQLRSRTEPRRRTVSLLPDSFPITRETERILDFRSIFNVLSGPDDTDARVVRLALAELERIVAPRRAKVPFEGGPLYRVHDEILWGMLFYRLEDFDVTLEIDHREILNRLEFGDGEILAELNVPSLQANCRFQLGATSHVLNVLLTIFTAGSYAAATILGGDLRAELRDARLTLSLAPERQPDRTMALRVSIDWTRSELPLNVRPGPLTPKASLTMLWELNERLIVKPVMAETLQAVLEETLGQKLLAPLIKWPTIWHAQGGRPPTVTTVLLSPPDSAAEQPGAGIWEGDSAAAGPWAARPVDASHALTEAYVLTPRTLTEWLRSRLAVIEHEGLLPAELLLDELGLSLPDPTSLPLPVTDDSAHARPDDWPADGCSELPPPAIDLGSQNVLLIRKASPVVRLPEDPRGEPDAFGPFESQTVGKFEMSYEFRLSAVRRRETPYAAPIDGGIARAETDFGGACGDASPWGYRDERVVLADYLRATGTVTGDLVIDFQPSDLGWLPTLRLSVLGEEAGKGVAPSLETRVSLGPHEEIFEALEAAELERVLAGVAADDVAALLARAGDMVRAPTEVPPFPLTERPLVPRALGWIAVSVHRALAPVVAGPGSVANLISWQGANYIVADGMVYWPVRVKIDPSVLFREGPVAGTPSDPKAT